MEISLALGGGGMRGIAHIGVIRCLEEAGYRISAIAGTSAGGIVAAVYAAGYNAGDMISVLLKMDQSRLFGRRANDGPSLLGVSGLSDILHHLLGDRTFNDLRIPVALTATDANTGKEVLLHHGKVFHAVLATIAVPGVFPPRHRGSAQLLDGAVVDPVPAAVSRWLAPGDPVIAVPLDQPGMPMGRPLAVTSTIPAPTPLVELVAGLRITQAFNIFIRSVEISSLILTELRLKADRPDVIICPLVARFGWLDKVDIFEVVDLGYQAAKQSLPMIKNTVAWQNRLQLSMRTWIGEKPNPPADHNLTM